MKNHYWLEDGGEIRIDNKGICQWINKHCENWVENYTETEELKRLGIKAKICPSFLDNVKKFDISFKPGNKVYTSVSGDDFDRYGWDKIGMLANENPEIEFHLYGNVRKYEFYLFPGIATTNVFVHGKVSKEQMNKEIKEMQGALRLIDIEGFSEIIVKSILMAQYPISLIEYPHMLKVNQLDEILKKKKPNIVGRNYYLKRLNKFPWVK